jgi:hypothetical protein
MTLGANTTSQHHLRSSIHTWGGANHSSPSKASETFESVTGNHYGALKYIAVPLGSSRGDNDLRAYIEIGWLSRKIASAIHENEYSCDRLENKARELVTTQASKMERDIKMFIRVITRKLDSNLRDRWIRVLFIRWKQLSYLPTVLNYGEKSSGKRVGAQLSSIRGGHLLDEPMPKFNLARESSAKRRQSSLGLAESSPSFVNRVNSQSPMRYGVNQYSRTNSGHYR